METFRYSPTRQKPVAIIFVCSILVLRDVDAASGDVVRKVLFSEASPWRRLFVSMKRESHHRYSQLPAHEPSVKSSVTELSQVKPGSAGVTCRSAENCYGFATKLGRKCPIPTLASMFSSTYRKSASVENRPSPHRLRLALISS